MKLPQDIGVIHFIGIGGIGMSGIAEVLHTLGYKVQGSDASESANVKRLRSHGIEIHIGHSAQNLNDSRVVVVSSAIKRDNPELIAAREKRLPVVRRAEMLAELMRFKSSIAVGGTHGKTTTTSLIGTLLEAGGMDPTVINGGIINAYGTNTRLGEGEWMVVEADESDGTFLKLPADVALITNIDAEHLDHFGDFDAVRKAFQNFVENVPFYGFAVMCLDHPEVQSLVGKIEDRRIITYGENPQADVRILNLNADTTGCTFDVVIRKRGGEDVLLSAVRLPMLGMHNVLNATGALAVAYHLGVKPEDLKKGLAGFSGVKRRFTKTGEWNGVTIIDDYGHHPVEIAAVLKAGRSAAGQNKLIAVVQPHRYSRLSHHFEAFCNCFNDADAVIVADVYAAGEQPLEGFNRDTLVSGIKAVGHREVYALSGPERLAQMLAGIASSGDVIICLGAGNITQWAYSLPAELEALS